MRRKSLAATTCPIARSLDVVGDWWTLLVIRDALIGATRFDQFGKSGIADNMLSNRLDLLVREGIMERRPYQEHPPRFEYLLTEKGRDLLPVIVSLARWGMAWIDGPWSPPRLIHLRCGSEVGLDFQCPTCGESAGPREIRLERRVADTPVHVSASPAVKPATRTVSKAARRRELPASGGH